MFVCLMLALAADVDVVPLEPRTVVLPMALDDRVRPAVGSTVTALIRTALRKQARGEVLLYDEIKHEAPEAHRDAFAACAETRCARLLAASVLADEVVFGTLVRLGGTYLLTVTRWTRTGEATEAMR